MSLRHDAETTATLPRAGSDDAPRGRRMLVPIAGGGGPLGSLDAIALDRPLVVGRGAGCDVILADDPAASREHARFTPVRDGVRVEDLGSRNGTFVQRRPISGEVVVAGGVVRIGCALFRIAVLDEAWCAAADDGPLVGGVALAPLRRMLTLVGPTEIAVLILGETGTGKEVAARLFAAASGRSGPFLAVNCAALPEALVESEMFGHVRGAFSGADRARPGLFASADGGTLFLDEVGDLPLPAQAKLLRVLEDGLVRPVGAEQARRVDVRVISATNHDLRDAVRAGRFRSDLLARLGAVEARMPSLRDRPEDLPALAAFLRRRSGRPPIVLHPDALEAMACHSWPHNVRELDQLLRAPTERDGELGLADLPPVFRGPLAETVATDTTTASITVVAPARAPRPPMLQPPREDLAAALRRHAGNVRQVSLELGIARGHLYRLLKRFDLVPDQFRAGTDLAQRGGREHL